MPDPGPSAPFLMGQDVSIRIVRGAQLYTELRYSMSFNDAVKTEIKESGHLGEKVNRFCEILNGYSGDFEGQVNSAAFIDWQLAVEARARREAGALADEFIIARLDQYSDGTTNLVTYENIAWGEMPTSFGGRGEFVKVKGSFACSKRTVVPNASL